MRLFDTLFAAFVLLPWLAADAEYEVGGFSFELADAAVPVAAAALLAAIVENWPREPRVVLGSALVRARNWLVRSPMRAMALVAAALLAALAAHAWLRGHAGLNVIILVWMLTHGATAALVALSVGLAAHYWRGEPWTRSFLVRLAAPPARAWLAAVERAPARALWLAAAAVGAVFFAVSLRRHWAFESHGFDLGIFTNVMWNLVHGSGYVSSMKGGINLFADHQSPLFWILAPLFYAIPRPETLLGAQAFGLAAGGPALYYLMRARPDAPPWVPAALPWLYWAYLPLRNANAFDFHPEVFMLPLFLWAFVGFAAGTRGRWLALLALLGAFAAKESASVVAVGIGAACMLNGGRDLPYRKLGAALIAAGVALFVFDLKVVPALLGGEYAYFGLYDRFGGGLRGLLLAPFTQPVYFFSELIDRERLKFLFWTLAPLAFLPLFNWRAGLAALPAYMALFLTEGDQRVRIVFHYGIEPASALFWALPFGLVAFARRFGWQNAGTWMLIWAIAAHGAGELQRARGYDRYPHASWLAAQLVPCLNGEAAMAASDSLVPHLATRSWISYPDQLQQRPSGTLVGCVVLDLSVDNWPLGTAAASRLASELPQSGYRQAWKCNDLTVFERAGTACLRCAPQCYGRPEIERK